MLGRLFRTGRPTFGPLMFYSVALALGLYFTFAAVQGDYGVFRRGEIQAESRDLRVQLERVRADLERMENLTRRLSDSHLDIDLLDEQARSVLGMIRADEIVIR